jgi:hypothetical protein
MIAQNWCTIDGKSWRLTKGDWRASVYLCSDEKKYSIFVLRINPECHADLPIAHGYFDCIKESKAACIEWMDERLSQEEIS